MYEWRTAMSWVALSRAAKEIGAMELTPPERTNWSSHMGMANLQLLFASQIFWSSRKENRGWNACHTFRTFGADVWDPGKDNKSCSGGNLTSWHFWGSHSMFNFGPVTPSLLTPTADVTQPMNSEWLSFSGCSFCIEILLKFQLGTRHCQQLLLQLIMNWHVWSSVFYFNYFT